MENKLFDWRNLHQKWDFVFLAGSMFTCMIYRAMLGEYSYALIDLLFVLWILWCAGIFRIR